MATKHKVCIITNIPAPYRMPVFEYLAQEYNLTVYFCAPSKKYRRWEVDLNEYSDFYEFLPVWSVGPLWINPTLFFEIVQGDYDAVLVGENGRTVFATISSLVAAKFSNTPYGIWSEGIDTEWYHEHTSTGTAILESLRRVVYRLSDGCLGYSEDAGKWLRRRGVREDQVVTGPQVFPKSLIKDPNDIEIPSGSNTTFAFVGYLEERKGVTQLVKAFRRANLGESSLLVVGDGPERNRVEKLAREAEDIHVLGYVDESEKSAIYDEADVLVLPTRHDAWGLVVNEALYFDTPVLTTKSAAASQLIKRSGAGAVFQDAEIYTIQDALETFANEMDTREIMMRAAERTDYPNEVKTGAAAFEDVFGLLLNCCDP